MKIRLRWCVSWFAEQMERKLRENDHKGGWNNCDALYLIGRINQEMDELQAAIMDGEGPFEIAREAVDVANYAMMIADQARKGKL